MQCCITLSLRVARVVAMPKVPLAKASISNTPIGPFQMTVLQSCSSAWKLFRESGPMSKPCTHAQTCQVTLKPALAWMVLLLLPKQHVISCYTKVHKQTPRRADQ